MAGPTLRTRTTYAGLAEPALLALARGGDPEAFRAIMGRANQRLFRVARAIVRSDDEAEDVLQEAYLSAFAHLSGFRGDSALLTWLTRIVLNEARGRLRRRHPTAPLDAIDPAWRAGGVLIAFPGVPADPEREAARGEMRRFVERAIDNLPDAFRVVFMLRAVEGLSIEETSAQLGVRAETIKTRLHRARHLLREALEREVASTIDEAFSFLGRRCERLTERVMARMDVIVSK